VLSFFVVLLVLFVVDVCVPAIDLPLGLVVLGWFASGAVVFLPAAEPHLARRLLGLRRPTDAEAVLVDAAWREVAPAAGVDPGAYSLWIDDRPGVNACVPGGRFLALPRSIVDLTPRQRAAVTAHELAHHLRGHASARLLLQWYSAPARAMLRTLAALVRTGGRGNPVLAPLGCLIGLVFLLLGGLGVWAVATMPKLRLTLLVLPFLPLLGRWAEKRCDRLAADAGYGPDLLAVLAREQESGQAARSEGGALSARPGATARAEALRRYLAGDA
jgi:STE24 endopeptidase